jgi:hypothetical protein
MVNWTVNMVSTVGFIETPTQGGHTHQCAGHRSHVRSTGLVRLLCHSGPELRRGRASGPYQAFPRARPLIFNRNLKPWDKIRGVVAGQEDLQQRVIPLPRDETWAVGRRHDSRRC